MKKSVSRTLSLLLTACLLLGMLPAGALAEDQETVLAKWADTLVTDATNGSGKMPIPIPAVDGTKKDGAELTRGGADAPTGDNPAVNATKSNQTVWYNNWTADDSYWQLKFSTSGVTEDLLFLRAGQYSTTNGPKHFQVKYSLTGNDDDFTAVGEPYALGTSKASTPAVNLQLPDALKDQETVYLRLYPTDGTPGSSNNSRIHDVYVVNAPAATQCETPTASAPANDGVLIQGSKVTLSCATDDVTFHTSTDAGDTKTWTALTGNTILMDNVGAQTIYVKAVDSTGAMTDSEVLTLTYTVAAPETPLTDGSEIVIFYAGGNMALTATAASKKLNGVAGTVAENKLTTSETAAVFTATLGADNLYRFVCNGKYLTTGSTGNSLSLVDAEDDYSQWTLETVTDGYFIRNVNASSNGKAQYMEYYSGFTTYGMGSNPAIYTFQLFAKNDVTLTSGSTDPSASATPAPTTSPDPSSDFPLATGDKVAIYYPKGAQAMTGNDADGNSRLDGASVTVSGDTLVSATADVALFDVTVDDTTQQVKFGLDGKFLTTGASGNSLTLAADAGELSLWTLESTTDGAGGWFIHSVGAKYNGNANQYMEYYSGFTTYSRNTSSGSYDATIYVMQFFPAAKVILPEVSIYDSDPDVVQSVAAWGGSTPGYDDLADKTVIPGDLYQSGDMKDAAAKFTVRANGAAAQAYQRTSGSGSTAEHPNYNYYMGATNVGAADGDYAQFEFPAAGYADMELSFRLRGTGTSAGEYSVQYSVDDGATFRPFGAGSYSYAYHDYGTSQDISGTGDIVGGKLPVPKDSTYFSYTLTVPAGAENAAKVLVRLVPGATRVSGTGAISGNIRIDSVVVAGHPIISDSVTGYVSVNPDNEEDQAAGTELTLTSATSGAAIQYRFVDPATGAAVADWAAYNAAAKPKLPDTLPVVLEAKATATGKAPSVTRSWTYAAGTVATVKMEPNGGGVYIAQAGDSVAVTLSCATDGATIYYSDTGEAPEDYKEYTAPIVLTKGFGSKTIRAYAVKAGFSDSALATRTFTERSTAEYSLYFGQIHSHTNYSDGAGSCDEAFTHAAGLSESWNIDFLAVTDHSNSFDNADAASIADGSVSAEWVEGHQLADSHTTDKFTGIYGYEMTWSNGLGHINTFNTPGFQSRTQSDYSTYSTALQNYYVALKTQPSSISQFNHPGTTFGDFSDFAHYDEELDNLITTIEVGNGEGAIGSSGYFPSYEYYTRALDKGWHVAPTNNQDNHKGNWGDANTGRTVVLADSLARTSIYDAMRNYRVYATEDLNLEIRYTLDGSVMGTILDGASGDTAHIQVALADPDDTASAKVQVIVNGGLVAAEKTATCNETVTFDVPSTYAYYYIKVTQADGDIAVTAPVWLGKVEAVGVGSMTAASDLTVAGQEQTISLELFNNENKPLTVNSIVFTDKATGKVLATNNTITSVPKLSTASCSFSHTFAQDGKVTIRATVTGSLKGVAKTYTQDLELTVMPAEMVRTVIVDGTHYNDYVTGYYGGNMNNMTTIAAGVGVQVKVIPAGETITAETLDNCALLVVSAPARKNGTANAGAYTASVFEDSFIDTVAAYVAGGGKVAVCGLADYQDKNAVHGDEGHAAAQLNKLLAAIGSTMTINDDEVYDTVHNGGQAYRLYPEIFNAESQWTRGLVTQADVAEGASYQTYSQYSGCSVNPGSGTWLVKGFDTTMGVDSDKDGVGNTDAEKVDGYEIVAPVGSVVFLAAEEVGTGTVFAAGGVFLSDFEVKAELDNIWDLPYANRTIYENILKAVREDVEATPIATIRRSELNRIFVAEGYVTSGTTDPNTTFFDAIYIQDETGGITVFPYAQSGLAIGTKVRIIGYTDAYQGDKELQISSLEILDAEPRVYAPTVLTTAQAADYDTNGGLLVKTQGYVSDIVLSGGVVAQFCLTDDSGVPATVFIDGYITNPEGRNTIGEWLQNGCVVSAVGLNYLHPEGDSDVSVPVLRVRNCDEIELISAPTYVSMKRPNTNQANQTTTVTDPDTGVVTQTVTDAKTGTVTETATYPSGAQVKSVTTKDGETTLSATLPKKLDAAVVTIPAQEVKPGDVVVLTKADGTEEVLTCVPESDGLLTLLTGSGSIRVEDRSTDFVDVHDGDWFAGDVDFASARGILNGTGDGAFSPLEPTTRAMVMTVLARMNGQDTSGGETWDAVGVQWAMDNGISDGTNTDQIITREQLAVMLWRYAGSPAAATELDAFQDNGEASDWAVDGLRWAVEVGLLQGNQLGMLMPGGSATRSQLSAVLHRFQGYMLKTQA